MNITDSGSFFQPDDPMVGSDDGWWPNDGTAWTYVRTALSSPPACTLTSGPVEAPWGDLEATLLCPYNHTYFLSGYNRATNSYIVLPWSDPKAQAFGHAFWQQSSGIATMYQSLHTSDTPAVVSAMPAMPAHFGPSTFSDPAFLASYNATRQGLTSALHPVSRSGTVRPAILFTLAVALGVIAVGAVMTLGGTLLINACNGQTDVKCLGKHTKAWERVGYVIAFLGTLMIVAGTLHPALPAAIWGTSSAVAGGATAVEGVELAAVASEAAAIADTTAAVAAEEALISNPFIDIAF